MKNLFKVLFVSAIFAFTVSCSDDDDNSLFNFSSKNDIAYVLNEGSGSGDVSVIDLTSNTVANDTYFKANNEIPLGSYPQSLAVSKNYLVIAVTATDNKGFIEIVDKKTMEHVASIDDLAYPRGVIVKGDYAYVSNGNSTGEIITVNLTTLEEEGDRIAVNNGPEEMIINGNTLYVACSGGWSNNGTTVDVVDLATKAVSSITTLACPRDMVMDAANNLWVFCGGVTEYDAARNPIGTISQGLTKINTATKSTTNFEFDPMISSLSAKRIAISQDGETIYYIKDNVYAVDYAATALDESSAFITLDSKYSSVYGIDVDEETGYVWCSGSTGYSTASDMVLYNEAGNEVRSYTVGINANSVDFSYAIN